MWRPKYRPGNRETRVYVSQAHDLVENLPADQGLERTLHDQIDFDAQELGQIAFQFDELEQARCFGKFYEYVEVAVSPGASLYIRTEYAEILDVKPLAEHGQLPAQGAQISRKLLLHDHTRRSHHPNLQ